jgi:glutathionylspermidine synthase
MERIDIEPRPNWEKLLEEQGFIFHTLRGEPYWDETAYYLFSASEIDVLEKASNELQAMCLEACQHVIDRNRFPEFDIPDTAVPLIRDSWEAEPPAIYGRFDLAYAGGDSPPKLLEYNADTPTSLFEASVIQWFWLEDRFKDSDQFNSIHERLQAKWTELKGFLKGELLHFASTHDVEDVITVNYLRDVADSVGLVTDFLHVDEIGWDREQNCFVDLRDRPIESIFKLYPWEWLVREEFGSKLPEVAPRMQWIEPIWKMLLSNKAILPILWELNPGHPNLLPCFADGPRHLNDYVRKPLLAREGANVFIYAQGRLLEHNEGPYDESRSVFQAYAPLPEFNGKRPVVGSWIIDGESAGIGMRETDGLITNNFSRFLPHRFK